MINPPKGIGRRQRDEIDRLQRATPEIGIHADSTAAAATAACTRVRIGGLVAGAEQRDAVLARQGPTAVALALVTRAEHSEIRHRALRATAPEEQRGRQEQRCGADICVLGHHHGLRGGRELRTPTSCDFAEHSRTGSERHPGGRSEIKSDAESTGGHRLALTLPIDASLMRSNGEIALERKPRPGRQVGAQHRPRCPRYSGWIRPGHRRCQRKNAHIPTRPTSR